MERVIWEHPLIHTHTPHSTFPEVPTHRPQHRRKPKSSHGGRGAPGRRAVSSARRGANAPSLLSYRRDIREDRVTYKQGPEMGSNIVVGKKTEPLAL